MKLFLHKKSKKTNDIEFNVNNIDIGVFQSKIYSKRIIVLYNDKVIGKLHFVLNTKKRVNVFNFHVNSEYRNKGIGRKMIQFLKTINNGKYDIDLEVKKDNDIAMKLYKSEGFEIARDCGYYYEMTCKKRE
jgi:ribosomal protein S18 acetylase RimI-like enzyme